MTVARFSGKNGEVGVAVISCSIMQRVPYILCSLFLTPRDQQQRGDNLLIMTCLSSSLDAHVCVPCDMPVNGDVFRVLHTSKMTFTFALHSRVDLFNEQRLLLCH